MISRVMGRLADVREDTCEVEVGGLAVEMLIPAAAVAELHDRVGQDVTLHTLLYLEGSPAGANLIPRLLGFLTESDRAFFRLFTRVKGISYRKGLRAMSVPAHQLALSIENGDARMLQALPEIGKKTATQLVAELQGKLHAFLEPSAKPVPVGTLTEAQRVATEILVQWGDRRADAQQWVLKAVEQEPSLEAPEAIVRAAYRVKQQVG